VTHFVFLEILDAPAVDLLTKLRATLQGRESRSPIHITVRGPYKTPPSPEKLDEIWSIIKGEGLLLHGIGRFDFGEKHVVYLKSHSHAIRKIWSKRDYPIVHYGFNPHISLFEGPPEDAALVEQFLRREQILLFCRQLSLSLYQSAKDDLFSTPSRSVIYSMETISSSPLVDSYRWREGIEQRVLDLVRKFSARNDDHAVSEN
jgi:hypothetical protein